MKGTKHRRKLTSCTKAYCRAKDDNKKLEKREATKVEGKQKDQGNMKNCQGEKRSGTGELQGKAKAKTKKAIAKLEDEILNE